MRRPVPFAEQLQHVQARSICEGLADQNLPFENFLVDAGTLRVLHGRYSPHVIVCCNPDRYTHDGTASPPFPSSAFKLSVATGVSILPSSANSCLHIPSLILTSLHHLKWWR